MDINKLIEIVKAKISKNIIAENINVEDKTFLHKDHKTHQKGKFHLKLIIKSDNLKKKGKIESSRFIHKLLETEIKEYIHSIQILIH